MATSIAVRNCGPGEIVMGSSDIRNLPVSILDDRDGRWAAFIEDENLMASALEARNGSRRRPHWCQTCPLCAPLSPLSCRLQGPGEVVQRRCTCGGSAVKPRP